MDVVGALSFSSRNALACAKVRVFIGEVMTSYAIVKGQTYLTFECLTIVAIIYFVLTFILTRRNGRRTCF